MVRLCQKERSNRYCLRFSRQRKVVAVNIIIRNNKKPERKLRSQVMDQIRLHLLDEVVGLHDIHARVYNIRENGKSIGRSTTDEIEIVPKEDGTVLDIFIKPGTKKKSVHIPVIISQSGLTEVVYNDFHI